MTKKTNRIPTFKSIQEEAEFWDTHDTTDFEDEFKPVKVRFAKNLSQGLTIRLDPDILNRVRTRAHQRGIGPTTLIRMWVMERLQSPHRRPAEEAGTEPSAPAYR